MPRSQLLRSTAFMAACLLTLSGCSVGWTGARGTSSAPPDQAQDTAPEAAEEPTAKVDPQGLNIIGKDVHAPVIRSCRSFS